MRRLFYFSYSLFLLTSCVYHDLDKPVIDCTIAGPSLALESVTPASTCGSLDGRIRVVAAGGEQPYTYLLNNTAQSSGDFQDLAAGIYSVGVMDVNGCDTIVTNVTVTARDFTFTAEVTKDSLCEANSGIIILSVEEVKPPYAYRLDDGVFAASNTFMAVSHGDHTVTIRDGLECMVSLHVTVPRGITGTSWSTDIRPVMETYCALSGCHNGSARVDLRNYTNARSYAHEIKSMTQDRSMPYDGSPLKQSDIDKITCWVDDGAPNN
jgi:hypothetical protein